MKQTLFLFLSSILAISFFNGCAATSQPSSTLPQVTSLKEYIAFKRGSETLSYAVVAEKENQTLIEYRTYDEAMNVADARAMMDVLDDAKGYCELIGGLSIYGDQAIKEINTHPTALSLDYVNYKSTMQKQGLGKYEGFFQCRSPKDGFAITFMKDHVEVRQSAILGNQRDLKETYSRFYMIQHDHMQSLGVKTWLKSTKYAQFLTNYTSFEEILGLEKNSSILPWRYERILGAHKYCTYYGGEFYVSNAFTQSQSMSIDDYLFTRINAMSSTTINVFMNQDTFICKNKDPKKAFRLIHTDKQFEFKQGE